MITAPKRTYRVSGNITPPAGTAPFITIVGATGRVIRVTKVRISGPTLTAVQLLRVAIHKFSTAFTGGTPVAGTKVPLDSQGPASLATVNNYTVLPTGGGALVGSIAEKTVLAQATVAAAGAPLSEAEFDFTPANDVTEFPTLRATTESIGVLFPVAPATAVTMSYTVEYTEDGN